MVGVWETRMPRTMWMVMAELMKFQRGAKTVWNWDSLAKKLSAFCWYPEDWSETAFQK